MMRKFFAGLAVMIFGVLLYSIPASAAGLQGYWRGGGFAQPYDGARERIRCRITYRKVSRTRYSGTARCSAVSLGAITQSISLRKVGKRTYRGSFYNAQYNVSGSFTVTVKGRRQYVTLRSNRGYARLTLRK